jgi:hypothetical protein
MRCSLTGKIRHLSRGAGRNHLQALSDSGQPITQMRVYHCRACRGFHVGFRAINPGDSITELLRRDRAARFFGAMMEPAS